MSRKYYPGEAVAEGIYWKNKTWEFLTIPDGGSLPTEEGVAYYWVPRVVVLLVGPLLGLVYVLTLPFAALLMVAYLGVRTAVRAVAPMRSGERDGRAGDRR